MNASFASLSTFQTQIQLLSPLTSCLASALNGRRSVKSRTDRLNKNQRNDKLSKKWFDYHSLDSVLNSAKQLFCDKKSPKRVSLELLFYNTNDYKCLKNRIAKVLVTKIFAKREPNHWITCHKSEWSFDDNKYCPNKQTNLRLLSKTIASFSLYNYCPNRTFKTRPDPFTGIGSAAAKNRLSKDQTSIGHKKLGSIFGLKKEKFLPENEKIKEYINEENLNSDEKDRIKIAFAEGYLAAEPKTKTSSKLRIFNVFRDLMGIVLIIAILFSFMGELSGTLYTIDS